MKTLGKIVGCVALLVLMPGGTALAACGIGSQIWEGRGGTGGKILAFTTNFWTLKAVSTTFEIVGCTEEDNLFKKGAAKAKNARIYHFASDNLDHLAVDMARGNGEHLDVLAGLIEIRETDEPAFRSLARGRFEVLFPHDHTTSDEMLQALSRLMLEDPVLSDYVDG